MYQLRFRFRDDDPNTELSIKHPKASMLVWCNFRHDVYELQAPNQGILDALVADLGKMGRERLRHITNGNGSTRQSILLRCESEPENSNAKLIENNAGLVLQPFLYRDGWEHWRVLFFDEEGMQFAMKEVAKRGRLIIDSKRVVPEPILGESMLVHTAELLEDLTKKQSDALLAALEHGYYEVPRTADLQTIAKRRGVPRTTFEEHVRKAEGKILRAMSPHVAVWSAANERLAGPGRPKRPARALSH